MTEEDAEAVRDAITAKATVLAMARQGLFFLPLILVLPPLFGVLGVQLSQPLSDLATFLLSVQIPGRLRRDPQRRRSSLLIKRMKIPHCR